jgi:hypothetical protein
MSEPVRGLFSFLDDITRMQEVEGLTSEEAWARWRELNKPEPPSNVIHVDFRAER